VRLSATACLALLTVGCTTGARPRYEAATDERSLATQTADSRIALAIRKDLLASDVEGPGSVDVFCRQGIVVPAGAVEGGSAR